MNRNGLLASCLIAACAVAEPQPLRCTVNATGNATRWNYFDRGWRDVPLVDFHVPLVQGNEPVGVPPDVQLAIAAQSPYCGTYISPGVEKPEEITEWPAAATPSTLWRDTDLLPLIANRRIPKINDQIHRAKLAAIMSAELATRPAYCPNVFVDNCGHHSSGWMRADGKAQIDWEPLMDLLGRLRSPNRTVIANLALHPLALSDAETQLLIDSVDGVALEVGIHPNARNTDGLRKLLAWYQRLLAADKIVVLMAVNGSLTEAADKEAELRYTAAIGYMLREPGQRLWVASPYWQASPDWQAWPEKLGEPKGSVLVLHDGTVTREFTGGWLIARPPRSVEVVTQ